MADHDSLGNHINHGVKLTLLSYACGAGFLVLLFTLFCPTKAERDAVVLPRWYLVGVDVFCVLGTGIMLLNHHYRWWPTK